MLSNLYKALTGLDQLDREDGGCRPCRPDAPAPRETLGRATVGAENHDIAPQVTGAAA